MYANGNLEKYLMCFLLVMPSVCLGRRAAPLLSPAADSSHLSPGVTRLACGPVPRYLQAKHRAPADTVPGQLFTL